MTQPARAAPEGSGATAKGGDRQAPSRQTLERRRTVALAGHTGEPATARKALDDPSPVVRCAGLGALDRLDALAGDQLEAALRDESPAVRAAAAEIAARRPEVDLYDLLADDEPLVAEAAAWACGERPATATSPRLLGRLCEMTTGHAEVLCREAAVAALGALGDPGGLEAILAATGDRATVRRRAVLALAAFDGPEVDAALKRATTDRDRQVRQAAEDLL